MSKTNGTRKKSREEQFERLLAYVREKYRQALERLRYL